MKYPDNLNPEEKYQFNRFVRAKMSVNHARLRAEAVNQQKYELGIESEIEE